MFLLFVIGGLFEFVLLKIYFLFICVFVIFKSCFFNCFIFMLIVCCFVLLFVLFWVWIVNFLIFDRMLIFLVMFVFVFLSQVNVWEVLFWYCCICDNWLLYFKFFIVIIGLLEVFEIFFFDEICDWSLFSFE